MTRPIFFSRRAEEQVAAIHAYIAEQSGEARADAVVGRLLDACRALNTFPARGSRRDDIRQGLRVMGLRRRATIAFIIEPERVVIHGVLGRGQDVTRLFDDETPEGAS